MRRALLALALAGAASAAPAQGATITVSPGPNAIQAAVDRADRGDRLLIRAGTYREDVTVDKRLRIIGEEGKRPLINGRCRSDTTIDVTANGVKLRHLKMKGARSGPGFGYTVNVVGVSSVILQGLVLKESCDGSRAYYGVNVFDTGALEIRGSTAAGGYADAGIYVGGIGDLGSHRLLVRNNEVFGNNVGILIEDSVPAANISVFANRAHGNDAPGLTDRQAGILVRRSDGGRYVGNRVHRNGDYGIHLLDDFGNSSDENVLRRNRARRNGGRNFLDQGVGNCGSGNSFPITRC